MNTPYNQNYKRNCSGNERLTKENTQFEAQLQFVSDAVMAFAYAFRCECRTFMVSFLYLHASASAYSFRQISGIKFPI